MSVLGPPADVPASRLLGSAAAAAVLAAARSCEPAVLESSWVPASSELWGSPPPVPGVGRLLRVDTSGPVDVPAVAAAVRSLRAPAPVGRLGGMTDPKSDLHRYLRQARAALLWKVQGASEYDARRPLTPTGTNLLGLVKHVAGVETGYLGETFGRPFPERLSWVDDAAEPNADMWATPEESRSDLLDLYRRIAAHDDATVEQLDLAATGRVPWWPPERAEVTLHQVLVHLIAEVNRHAGHADIVRELADGAVGMRAGDGNLPPGDAAWWQGHHDRVEAAARSFRP